MHKIIILLKAAESLTQGLFAESVRDSGYCMLDIYLPGWDSSLAGVRNVAIYSEHSGTNYRPKTDINITCISIY